jgi:RNA polymerase sigma-70 factor (ECF subfamily)
VDSRTDARFEQVVLPHLDAAYNLARWMMRREHDAQDVVQEAFLRAFHAFGQFRGGDARCWLLTIVRNTCHTWHTRDRARGVPVSLDQEVHDVPSATPEPQALLERLADRDRVRAAFESLPAEFREVLVLRELEGLTYQEVAAVAKVPVGTVMSRLARARERLARALCPPTQEEATP